MKPEVSLKLVNFPQLVLPEALLWSSSLWRALNYSRLNGRILLITVRDLEGMRMGGVQKFN